MVVTAGLALSLEYESPLNEHGDVCDVVTKLFLCLFLTVNSFFLRSRNSITP